MKLPTLERLESLGLIKETSTPRQIKNNTTIYEVIPTAIKKFYLPKLGIYRKNGKVVVKDITTNPRILKDESHFIYRVINELLLLEPKRYNIKGAEYYFSMFACTDSKAKKYIDNMSEDEFIQRIDWVNKIYSVQRLYGENKYGGQDPRLVDIIGPFKLTSK